MTVNADIQAILRTVPGMLGVATWSYRRLASGPVADSRTYGSWTAFSALVTGRSNSELYEDATQTTRRVEKCRARTSDALADLHVGDQVKDANGETWAVMGILSSGIGTLSFDLQRDQPLAAKPNRPGGGV